MDNNRIDKISYNPNDILGLGDEPSYKPNDILGPWKCSSYLFPYDGALGNRSWELVASYFVSTSQRKGHWVTLLDFHSGYDTKGMIKAGFLEVVYKGKRKEWSAPTSASVGLKKKGVKLTPKALEKLVQHTDPKQSVYIANYCDKIIDSINCPAGGLKPKVSVPDEAQLEECLL